ncbi:GNAT family N-acetyltransferase [Halorarius litoreus]|uniref:GNAT family N-acetyltransferase n=1 Tax=Halorarius litoreus TaxID=2962676 RepID=UPI0020CDE5DF|nr:GNAT family N-acetyltransferase [Halorarius litoreus]
MEYRPIPDDDAGDELFVRYVQYAFQPTRGPDVSEALEADDRPDPPRFRRGLYPDEGDEPVTILSSYDFTTRLRGTTLSMGGVSTVATPPEHRRNGYVATLLRELCREYREGGTPISALWPFEHPFYRKYGWATCNRYLDWSAAPSDLRAAASEPAGEWRQLDRDDWEPLDAVHDAAMAGYELAVDRTGEWWTERVLRSWQTDPFVYCWFDDAGTPRAHLVYTVTGDWGDRTLKVQEQGAADAEAFGHVLRFLADHDSQVKAVEFSTDTDAGLLDRVADPRKLDCTVEAGPMFRLVDVEATCSALSYPTDGEVVVALDDPLLPEVTGSYALSVADGRATCERTDAPAAAETDVGAFSQLVCGYRSAETLATAGELTADADALATLDALFPKATPLLKEGF